ncbi:MAG TPA: hypothetical protein DCE11_01660 [Ruminiclostridium sp.]|jgi:hypothetical protein|nr:hypothetical protein [Ruminiclostridium sp.]
MTPTEKECQPGFRAEVKGEMKYEHYSLFPKPYELLHRRRKTVYKEGSLRKTDKIKIRRMQRATDL